MIPDVQRARAPTLTNLEKGVSGWLVKERASGCEKANGRYQTKAVVPRPPGTIALTRIAMNQADALLEKGKRGV